MSRRNFVALTESLALRPPLFVLMRRGRAAAVVSDMEPRSALDVLGLIYGRGKDGWRHAPKRSARVAPAAIT